MHLFQALHKSTVSSTLLNVNGRVKQPCIMPHAVPIQCQVGLTDFAWVGIIAKGYDQEAPSRK
jgi:hypothetical protein